MREGRWKRWKRERSEEGMSETDVVAVAACGAIFSALMALAWCAGRSAGYWARVREEKEARGIR